MKKKITIVNKVLFTDAILDYFYTKVKGMCSEYAYYELLIEVEKYMNTPSKNFEEYVEMIFNIGKKDLVIIKKQYKEKLKEIEKFII